ncbi:MAG: AraC family transcriptional regulator [Paenibacillus sp.]|nr:AraC family transcriptional regulator [Paenibacillus sp.]
MLTNWNSVYSRLFLSLTFLLLVTAMTIGTASYLYFTANFKREVEKVNARLLLQISQQLHDNMIGRAQRLLMQAATDPDVLYLFNNTLQGNFSRLADARQTIGSLLLQYPESIESAAVYYRDHGAVVSSGQGIALLDSLPDKPSAVIDWVERIERTDRTALWIGPRGTSVQPGYDPGPAEVVTLVSRFPYQSQSDKTKGYIAINMKAEAVENMIRSDGLMDRGQLWIVDGDGQSILPDKMPSAITPPELSHLWTQIGEQGGDSGSFSTTADGEASLVSFMAIPSSDWKLVQVTPLSDYYREAIAIQRMLVWICLGAIGLGLVISNMLTFKLYRPLRSLLHTIRGATGGTPHSPNEGMNEYKQIDHLFADMTVKMSELERTVIENAPLVRHNLATGLLSGTIVHEKEYEERQKYLRLDWQHPCYCALLVRFRKVEFDRLDVGKRQIVVYNLIREIELETTDGLSCLAASMQPTEIAIVVHAPACDEELAHRLLCRTLAFAMERFRLKAAASIGDWTENPLRLHLSYAAARRYIEYGYFMPDVRIFPASRFGEIERGSDEIPESVFDSFSEALRAKDRRQVRHVMEDVAAAMEKGTVSAERGHECWRKLIEAYRQYVKEMHLKSDEIIGPELLQKFRRIDGSGEMQSWLIAAAEATFDYLEQRARNKTSEAIEQIKAFVERHLSRDLSLNAVAESVRLHPGYISKRFKEETGVNFVDYVNQRRIQAAVHWLHTTDRSVEQIASSVGFNTTAYFIRKFKDVYGLTPKAYQANYRLRNGE